MTAFSNITYQVIITDIYGCSATKYVNINALPKVIADAGTDDIIRFGESIQLHAKGGSQYQWINNTTLSNTSIPNPIATPIDPKTTYYLRVKNDNGCEAIDSVSIFLTNGFVPNAFTPNGDGSNDIFRFYPANDYINLLSLKVFDRWGRAIFISDDVKHGWNGQFKGVDCRVGTYFYFVEYSIGGKSHVYKGDLTLLR